MVRKGKKKKSQNERGQAGRGGEVNACGNVLDETG